MRKLSAAAMVRIMNEMSMGVEIVNKSSQWWRTTSIDNDFGKAMMK